MAAALIKVRITRTINNEYDSRCVFNGEDEYPMVPSGVGEHELPRATVEMMLDDAEYNGSVGRHRGQGPDEMPLSIGNAYRALAKQLSEALKDHK